MPKSHLAALNPGSSALADEGSLTLSLSEPVTVQLGWKRSTAAVITSRCVLFLLWQVQTTTYNRGSKTKCCKNNDTNFSTLNLILKHFTAVQHGPMVWPRLLLMRLLVEQYAKYLSLLLCINIEWVIVEGRDLLLRHVIRAFSKQTFLTS